MSPEPFVDARAAARFAGFEPNDALPARRDPAMRAFWHWLEVARVPKHQRGRRCLVFRLSELEAAITAQGNENAPAASLTRMEALAREHVLRVVSRTK